MQRNYKVQTTYKGQTARQILNTANIATMQAGNVEIVVTVNGRPAHAQLGSRTDGWGGTIDDVLVITDVAGLITRLLCGGRAIRDLERLTADVERQQRILNDHEPEHSQ